MSRKALLIGINYIGTSSALRGCINDVLNIKHFLHSEFKLTEEEVTVLTEASGIKPTKANIIQQIQLLVKDAKPGDKLFVHYSGHGTHIKDVSGDESDNRDECICPVDYSRNGLITDDELRKILIDPLPKGCQLFGIFDCCHSGTILDLKYNYLFNANPRRQNYNVNLEKKAKPCRAKVTMLSGCKDDQISSDAYIERTYQGAMTYSFLKMYEKLKKKDKKITCQRLMKQLNIFVKKGGFTQVPRMSTGNLINLKSQIAIL